ncbi:hypothetical protein HMPREF9333_01513 [Johnsonella ignava ATCC 51276]|uniref:D,D-heptose 1,7-bisphosphate phosphatase n=1 Tax=Johnsonella ignava ATCC 51276 TaxID=679200 RepID=G5GIX3_9FIRM|nr:HAD-IIIA family hydrolase [Johnsonella ignava]EHI55377.1 hypothetical protein HMPREF9333_01513 [Johnsonella ignava ATCC 51276]
MHAVIMAGGKGSRLASITKNEIPKPMVDIKSKPLLEWQLEELKKYGITTVTMVVGYLSEKIIQYFGNGEDFGCEIDYIIEEQALGTAGAFCFLTEKFINEKASDGYFMLVFGDVFFDIDIKKMENFHIEKKSKATLFVHPNSHPFDSDLVKVDEYSRVVEFDSKNNVRDYWYDNLVNAGLYILDKSICTRVPLPVKTDFEKDILAVMAKNGEEIYAYKSPEFVKDIGTVERITSTVRDIESGFINSKNLSYKQKAIFLDRDGTINKFKGLIYDEDEFELEAGAIEAIGLINKSGMLAIVATNQPVVARGLCDIKDVENIHKKLSTLLGREGVFLDDIFFCPHHPDRGYPEENPRYKVECKCRKPDTGMAYEAAQRYHIDLKSSWMIGDTTIDMEFARRLGMRSVLLKTGEGGLDCKFEVKPDIYAENILDAVKKIFEREKINMQ